MSELNVLKCPRCGTLVDAPDAGSYASCHHCGTKLLIDIDDDGSTQTPSKPKVSGVYELSVFKCPHCGALVDAPDSPGEIACQRCHTRLSVDFDENEDEIVVTVLKTGDIKRQSLLAKHFATLERKRIGRQLHRAAIAGLFLALVLVFIIMQASVPGIKAEIRRQHGTIKTDSTYAQTIATDHNQISSDAYAVLNAEAKAAIRRDCKAIGATAHASLLEGIFCLADNETSNKLYMVYEVRYEYEGNVTTAYQAVCIENVVQELRDDSTPEYYYKVIKGGTGYHDIGQGAQIRAFETVAGLHNTISVIEYNCDITLFFFKFAVRPSPTTRH